MSFNIRKMQWGFFSVYCLSACNVLTHAVYDALEVHLKAYKTLSFSLVIMYTTFLYILRKTEKSADRRRLQRPKPNLVRSSGRTETAKQDKMGARTTSPTLANAGEKVRQRNVT